MSKNNLKTDNDSNAQQEKQLLTKLKQLQQKITQIKTQSLQAKQKSITIQNNYTKANHKMNQQQQQKRTKILSIWKKKIQQKYKKQQLKGLVTQVPQKSSLQYPTTNPYTESQSLYYVSQMAKSYKNAFSPARQHIRASIEIMKSLENSVMPSKETVAIRRVDVGKQKEGKICLLFDLDETLIHCLESPELPHDTIINIKMEDREQEAAINIRPYATQILKNLSAYFELMVFTASQKCYADEVLKHLDPQNKYISYRMYRQHCYFSPQNTFIKDLRIINRPLSRLLLIDNAYYSYAYQPENGVPIINYYHGKNDFQLKALEQYLMGFVGDEGDVRVKNRKMFRINQYGMFRNYEELVDKLYCNR